jgi:F-type H+-transporting ATPase subunit epsilon
MAKLLLTSVSPEKKVIEKLEVSQVTLQTEEGQIQILPGHARMVGVLDTGVFSYTPVDAGASPISGAISFGFFEVQPEEIHVMAQTIERKDEIDLARTEKALLKAREGLAQEGLSEENFNKYQLKLQRALIRQQSAGKTH